MDETLRAVANTVVPEMAELTDAAWREVRQVLDDAVRDRPVAMQRQLHTFLRVIEWLPLLRHGRRFSRLDDARRALTLLSLQESPVAVLRRGMWGLRTLLFLGYYTRPDVAAALGYRAQAAGWSARRSAPTDAPLPPPTPTP